MNENENFSQEEYVYEEAIIEETGGTDNPSKKLGMFLEKIIPVWLLAVVFFLPVFIIPLPGIDVAFSKNLFLSAGVIIGVLLSLILWLSQGEITFPRNPLFTILSALVVWYVISAFASGAFIPSFFGNGEAGTAFSFLLFVLLALLITIFFQKKQRTLSVLLALTLSGIVVFLFQIVHILFLSSSTFGGTLMAKDQNLIGNWSDFGIFSGLMVIFSLIALETIFADKKKFRGILIALLIIAFFFHILAAYNSSWILLTLSSGIIAFFSRSLSRRKRVGEQRNLKMFLTPSLLVAFLSFILIFAGPAVNAKMFELLNMAPSIEIRPSWQGTFDVVRGSLGSGAKTALLGAGPNRFFTEWVKFHPIEVNLTQWWSVDFNNGIAVVPESIVVVGIIGFLLWVGFLLGFFTFGFRALRSFLQLPDVDDTFWFLFLSSFLGTSFLFVVLCMNTPNSVILSLAFILFGIFVGVLSQMGIFPPRVFRYLEESPHKIKSVIGLFILLAIMVILGFSALQRDRSVFAYHRAISSSIASNTNDAEIEITRAIGFSKDDSYFRAFSMLSSFRANQVLARSDLTPDDIRLEWNSMFRSAVQNAQNATIADSQNYANWVLLGNTYAALVPLRIATISDDAYASAQGSYEKARTLNPKSPGIPFALANLANASGKQDETSAYLEQALALKPNYSDALNLYSQIQISAGHPEKAIPYLMQAINISPADPVLFFELGFVQFKNSDYAAAATSFERSIALVPNYANAEYFLGLTYSKLGRVQDAIKQMKDVQASNPDRADVASIISNLSSGYPPFASASAEAKATSAPKKP